MGNKFTAEDLENWKPKTKRRRSHQSVHHRTVEYMIIFDKIDNESLHLTREPSKHSRLNYMHALCDILDAENSNKKINCLSVWNWRFLGSNDKFIIRLAQALERNECIEILHLVNCHIDCRHKIRIIIEALKKRNVLLSDIDLSGNNFGNDENAIKLLATFLSTYQCTNNLKKITLRATKLTDDHFIGFVDILSQSHTLLNSLELFSVTHNKLKSHSMEYLTKWLLSKQKTISIGNNTNDLIKHLSSFRSQKPINLALTTNPIKDSGIKRLRPLMESDIVISELHLRSCSITTRGIGYLLDSYLIRQKRVIDQYTKLIYNVFNECCDYLQFNKIHIPLYLCSIIIQHISDWTLDDRLKIHFGLSRCSLSIDDGFNMTLSHYIMDKKLIAKCLDLRMKDTQNTEINIINIYKLVHFLRYSGNGCLGRLIFCVSSNKFNISNQMMQLLPTNITEMDIDNVINNIIDQETKKTFLYNNDFLYNGKNRITTKQRIQSPAQNIMTHLISQQNQFLNEMEQRQNRLRSKAKKMEDILTENDDINPMLDSYDQDDDDDEDDQIIVDMMLLEKLHKVHVQLKRERAQIYDNGDITFQLNTNSDYGDFDAVHTSYIDVFGEPINLSNGR